MRGALQVGHLSSYGDQTLADEGVPAVSKTSFPEADLRDHAGSPTGSKIPELSIETSSRGFQELPHQFIRRFEPCNIHTWHVTIVPMDMQLAVNLCNSKCLVAINHAP